MPELINFTKPEPNVNIIEALEIALAEARNAEFVSLVMVKVRADGRFATKIVSGGDSSVRSTVGALAFAQFDLMRDAG